MNTSRPRGHRRRISPAKLYAVGFAVLIVVAVLAEVAIHAVRTDPRDARTIAERELQLNTLQPGERVLGSVSVFKRPAINYFRATRGLLVLTNQRLLYLGLQPRDLLAASDVPPTFEERDFPVDTMVQVTAGRTMLGIARGVVISTPHETLRLGVPSSAWSSASALIATMGVRYKHSVATSAQQQAFLKRIDAERRAAEAARHRTKFYVVRRGDALGSIATIWNTTPQKLRTWNRLPDNRIRVGDSLMVRPAL